MKTKTKAIAIVIASILAGYILGILSGVWIATPDTLSGAPQDKDGNVIPWAYNLCECEKNGIHYLMPDVWSRGAEQ